MDAASGWSSSFEGLPIRDENGRDIVYTIREIAVPNYVAEVSGNAEIGFAVLNIYEEVLDDEDVPRSPFAGDGIVGLVLTCILSAGACKCFRHKKKDNSDEE